MNLNFIQGIVTYPSAGNVQQFLTYSAQFVSIDTSDGRTDINFAQGSSNYLVTEATNVPNAWGPIASATDAWLYWDVDTRTGVLTRNFTLLQPLFGSSKPATPTEDQHWFDTTHKMMYVFTHNAWKNVIRVFAAKFNTGVFTPLGSGFAQKPFAGTQVGVSGITVLSGRILIDSVGMPVANSLGSFFTTESDIFVNGSPVNVIRLEANILIATALENIAAFQPVKYTQFGEINLATYNDIQTTVIGIAMEDMVQSFNGTVCLQGHVTNPAWSWATTGVPIWIDGSGQLTLIDPHVTDASTFPDAKPPVGRVVDATSIIFDQGMGGKGEKGDPGSAIAQVSSPTVLGVSKLSVIAADPTNPITVGDNDPRNTNARTPLAHTHAATAVLPTPVGILTGTTLQDDLVIIDASYIKKATDTMLGPLTLNADPVMPLQASTKQYVDAVSVAKLSDTTIVAPVSGDLLSYNGTTWANVLNTSAGLSTTNVFTAPQIVAPVDITIPHMGTVTLDLSVSNNIDITKQGVATIMLPASADIPDGMTFKLVVKNVNNFWCALNLDSRFKFPGGVTPTWDLTNNATNIIDCYQVTADGDVLCSATIGVQ